MSDDGHQKCDSVQIAAHVAEEAEETLNRRYRMICEMGQVVTSEMNLEALFDLIMEQTTSIIACEQASVFLYNPDSEQLCSLASTDLKANTLKIPTHCGIAGWVFTSRTPLVVNDPYSDPRFFPGADKINGFLTRNILCAPLVNHGKRCIGTLQALNKSAGEFNESDLELLKAASYYVTIALENARLYEELKALDKAKERVINHLSHEIRTPLSIIGFVLNHIADRVDRQDLAKVKKTLALGERNLKRLKVLQNQIDDILRCRIIESGDCNSNACGTISSPFGEDGDFRNKTYPESSQYVPGQLSVLKKGEEFYAEAIEVNGFLQEICRRAMSSVGNREICLIQNFDADAYINIDRQVLEKVCSGLLKNAIENTPDEGTVEVAVEKRKHETRVTFTDHGVGITSTNQRMIFGGFFHTQPTNLYASKKPYAFNAGGTGADLLRIKSFSKRLGFEVEFSSRRCPFLPRDRDICQGKISNCCFVKSNAECFSNSGSTFIVRFPGQFHSMVVSSFKSHLPITLQCSRHVRYPEGKILMKRLARFGVMEVTGGEDGN
jgi:signal transduction histidine kinase